MTAKEKAKQLVGDFRIHATSRAENDGYCEYTRIESSRQCALICVDEMINCNTIYMEGCYIEYWQEVKQEINKL
jgi:hypothetical protein